MNIILKIENMKKMTTDKQTNVNVLSIKKTNLDPLLDGYRRFLFGHAHLSIRRDNKRKDKCDNDRKQSFKKDYGGY
jgi:hypothetical protein